MVEARHVRCIATAVVVALLAAAPARRGAAAPKKRVAGDAVLLFNQPLASYAHSINASGQVVGWGTTDATAEVKKAFQASAGGGGKYLPTFGSRTVTAYGVNAAGTPVGTAGIKDALRAFRGSKLLPEVAGQFDSYAVAINSSNQVAGQFRDQAFRGHAVRWGADGRPTDLGVGRVLSINDGGAMAGDNERVAVVWDASGTQHVLPDLGGGRSGALDINNLGVVVGWASDAAQNRRAVLWKDGQITVLDDQFRGMAAAVNDAGVVVGNGDYPFIWDAVHGLRNLSCLLPGGSDWPVFREVADINDSGVVVGQGLYEPDGAAESRAVAFAFTPGANVSTCPGDPGLPPGTVQGVVEFEKILVTSRGLQPGKPQRRPAAEVVVEAVRVSDDHVLATTETDYRGHYEMVLATADPVRLRVAARMGNVEVRDVVSGDVFAPTFPSFSADPGGVVVRNALLRDSDRASGPFNILSVVRRCRTFLQSYDPDLDLPALTIRWSVNRRDGTFFVNDPGPGKNDEMFVNGDRSENSDEFDDTVVAHEYGHYFTQNFSRDDSRGGRHVAGQQLDPRVAWSEGWAHFFGCAAMGTPVQYNSSGRDGRRVQSRNLEKNIAPRDVPGHWSEDTVASVLWDLFDVPADTGDTVTLGFGPIRTAMLNGMRDETFVYLLDLCDVLIRSDASLAPGIQSNLAAHKIVYTPAATPPAKAPFPTPIGSGVPARGSADSLTTERPNSLAAARFFEFTLGAPVSVSIALTWSSVGGAPSDLDLFLLDRDGLEIASSKNGPGTTSEQIDRALEPGTYVIEVRSFSDDVAGHVFNRGQFTLTATY